MENTLRVQAMMTKQVIIQRIYRSDYMKIKSEPNLAMYNQQLGACKSARSVAALKI